MEMVYHNHVDVAPAADSWVYPYDDSQYYMLRDHRPIPYGPTPVFLHPGGHMNSHDAMNATIFFPNGSQLNYIQQPMFHRNLEMFRYDMPVIDRSLGRGELAAINFRGQFNHTGTVNNPVMFDGSLGRIGYGHNSYDGYQSDVLSRRWLGSHNEQHPFSESCFFHPSPANANFSALSQDMIDQYSLPVCMSGSGWTPINEGLVEDTCYGTNLRQSNIFPMAESCLHQNFHPPEDKMWSNGAIGTVRYITEDSYRGFGGSIAAPKPFGVGQALLPMKEKSGSCKMGLSNTSGKRIPIERNYTKRHYVYRKRVGTNPTKSLVVSSPLRSLGSSSRAKQFGQHQKASAPRQVWQKKAKAQPAASRSKRSEKRTTPVYHITWDGFDEQSESEPVGQHCPFCQEDLSYGPTNEEYGYYDGLIDEPCNLPDVSVLPCGHAFHSRCLELITPEEHSTDPPCHLCSSTSSGKS